MLWIACGLLTIGFAAMLVKFFLLKKDIRQLGQKLDQISGADTNALLTSSTFDTDISTLVESINKTLEKTRRIGQETRQLEEDLKRAITNISHDLRTPLTSAKGYLQMAENGQLDEETLRRYLSVIHGRLDALTVLLDSLFAFSRAVEGELILSRINIGNTLRNAVSDSFAELKNRSFTVENLIPDAPAYYNCNEDALKRVLQNLISNAYTHGKEFLRVKLSDGVVEIANRADHLDFIDTAEIFNRFYTADASRTDKRTGLGLAIAKELTTRMGGQISAHKADDLLVIRVLLPK